MSQCKLCKREGEIVGGVCKICLEEIEVFAIAGEAYREIKDVVQEESS